MIALVKGEIAGRGPGYVVIMTPGGVGYKVFVGPAAVPTSGQVTLHTSTVVREDAISVFGFSTPEERDIFEALLGVSGIGPKTALAIVSGAGVRAIRLAVATQDASMLVRVPGVGKKTAQRLILDLKDKLGSLEEGSQESLGVEPHAGTGPRGDAVAALMALGLSAQEAEQAVAQAAKALPADSGLEQLVREAIKRAARVPS